MNMFVQELSWRNSTRVHKPAGQCSSLESFNALPKSILGWFVVHPCILFPVEGLLCLYGCTFKSVHNAFFYICFTPFYLLILRVRLFILHICPNFTLCYLVIQRYHFFIESRHYLAMVVTRSFTNSNYSSNFQKWPDVLTHASFIVQSGICGANCRKL